MSDAFDEDIDGADVYDDANYGNDASYQVNIPTFYGITASRHYDYESMIVDYADFDQLTEAINAARIALVEITDKLNSVERKEAAAKTKFERVWRRAYLASTKKTDTAKKSEASMMAEDAEDEVLKYSQAKSEYNRLSSTMRMELQTLQVISNNFRQQMKMV